MQRDSHFSLRNLTKGKLPRLPFARMKKAILGTRFEVSLVFVTDGLSQTLHKRFMHKSSPANVLSFPLNERTGEIFLNPQAARREAKAFHSTPQKYIGYLFIHALLHLKGFRHGSKMEVKEREYRARFDV